MDGRQLYSDPCLYKSAVYTRYNTSELFEVCPFQCDSRPTSSLRYDPTYQTSNKLIQHPLPQRYEVVTDEYHHIPRLNLYKFDGSPLMPLYLAYSPPEMLPTTTLNPLTTSAPGGAKATGKVKRSELPLNHNVINKRTPQQQQADRWWWFGVFLTASGGVLYIFF